MVPLAVFASHFFQGYETSLFLLKLGKDDYKHVFYCDIKLRLQKTDHTKLPICIVKMELVIRKMNILYSSYTF